MKAKEIMLHISRSLGNYEFAKMSVTYEINEGDDVVDSFKSAQLEINEAFETLFPDYYDYRNKVEEVNEVEEIEQIENYDKKELTENSPELKKIINRLEKGTATIEDVEKYYFFNDKIREILTKSRKKINN